MADPRSTASSATQDVRQRRPLAPSYSYPNVQTPNIPTSNYDSSTTAIISPTPFLWTPYLIHWQNTRAQAALPKHMLMRLAEVVLVAASIKLIASANHLFVLSIDSTWETISRRASSPFSPVNLWTLAIGLLAIAGWHLALIQISIAAGKSLGSRNGNEAWNENLGDQGVQRKGKKAEKNARNWGFWIDLVVLPTFLALTLVFFLYNVLSSLWSPVYIATAPVNNGSASGIPDTHLD